MLNKIRTHHGQGLAEYMALVPIAIAIIVVAGFLTTEIISAFEQTEEAFQPVEYVCQDEDPVSEPDGPLVANLGPHSVELMSSVYNEETNQTVVTYRVTNGDDPAISHWTLGLPLELQSKILSISEGNTSWGLDPTTGVTGLKFDTGYESAGDKGKEEEEEGEGKGKGKNKTRFSAPVFTFSAQYDDIYRDIKIAFAGVAEWESRTVTIKAGTETYHTVITAPVRTVELPAGDPLCQ